MDMIVDDCNQIISKNGRDLSCFAVSEDMAFML